MNAEALHAPTIDDAVIPHLGKFAHAAACGLLALLLFQAVRSAGLTMHWFVSITIVFMVMALGCADEWVQSFVPGRTASLRDLLADAAGALVCMGCLMEKRRNSG